MDKKFARIAFSESKDTIPVKSEFIRKAPERIFDWYVRKFNPFVIIDTDIGDVKGFQVTLPVVYARAFDDLKKTAEIMDKTLQYVYDMDVYTLTLPKGYDIELPLDFYVADGQWAKLIFLNNLIKKTLKNAGKNLKHGEILIIEGDRRLTETVIDAVYEELNFLNIVTEESEAAAYQNKAEEVFEDSGLNIGFGKRGSQILKEADVIINLSENPKGYDTYYKKGACYIELSGNKSKFQNLVAKRGDIAAIDSFNLNFNGKTCTLAEYEMYLYLKNKEFSKLIRGKGTKAALEVINSQVKADNIKLKLNNRIG